MKIAITALSWTILALGVCSNGLAQHDFSPLARNAGRWNDSLSDNVVLIGKEPATSAPGPADSTDDFPELIGISDLGSCDNGRCCGNDCCDSSGASCFAGWNVKFAPNMWLHEIHGNATVGGVTQNIHISTRDLFDLIQHDAHFFFSGKLELEQEQGPLGIIANGYYINAGLGEDIEFFSFFKKFEQAIVDVAFTYEMEGMADALSLPERSQLELLAGFRYWMFDTGVTVTRPLGRTGTFDGKDEWVDPIIGGRVVMPIGCYSDLQVRGDVGGFDWGTASHFTWNFEALIETRCSDCCAIRAGYRILDVDHEKSIGNNQLGFDVQYRGPVAELVFTF